MADGRVQTEQMGDEIMVRKQVEDDTVRDRNTLLQAVLCPA